VPTLRDVVQKPDVVVHRLDEGSQSNPSIARGTQEMFQALDHLVSIETVTDPHLGLEFRDTSSSDQ
jgi:hypothetical protein